jgi:UDP-glucose/iron transport system permease protein
VSDLRISGDDVRLLLGVVVLLAVMAVVLRAARVPLGWAPHYAVARGALQLTVVGLLLRGVLTAPIWVAVALGVMLSIATWTARGRISALPRPLPAVAGSMVAGVGVVLGVVFGVRMLEPSPRYLVAIGGIVIGGTMLAVSQAGRRLAQGLAADRDEVEGLLALGATDRQASARIGRRAIAEALIPVTDQTRTTGLVTLPGAFVGALLGGASPTQAAKFQLVVLAGLLTAQALAAVLVVHLLSTPLRLPGVEQNDT